MQLNMYDAIECGVGSIAGDQSLFHAVFNEASIGIAILDATGVTKLINPALASLLTSHQLGSILSLLPEGKSSFRPILDRSAERLHFEHKIPLDKFQELWVDVTLTAHCTGSGLLTHVIGVVKDITDHKQSEAKLRDAEKRYRSIFENAIEGIFQTTADGRYLAANPALARIYGYASPEDMMSSLTNIASQLYLNPNRRDEFIMVFSQNDMVQDFESEIIRKDGSVIWISESSRAVRNSRGDFLYYEGMVEDITERKQAELRLLHDAFHDSFDGSSQSFFVHRPVAARHETPRAGEQSLRRAVHRLRPVQTDQRQPGTHGGRSGLDRNGA